MYFNNKGIWYLDIFSVRPKYGETLSICRHSNDKIVFALTMF